MTEHLDLPAPQVRERIALIASAGLTPVAPGEAHALQLLGRYTGTVRTNGLRWVSPLTARRNVPNPIVDLDEECRAATVLCGGDAGTLYS